MCEFNENYFILEQHLKLIESGKLTEDIFEEFKTHIYYLRDVFYDFSSVNTEIKEEEFRNFLVSAEYHMKQTIDSLKKGEMFPKESYKRLLQNLINTAKFAYNKEIEEELSDMMKNL